MRKNFLIQENPLFKGSLDADTVSVDLLKLCKAKKTEQNDEDPLSRAEKSTVPAACILGSAVDTGAL